MATKEETKNPALQAILATVNGVTAGGGEAYATPAGAADETGEYNPVQVGSSLFSDHASFCAAPGGEGPFQG